MHQGRTKRTLRTQHGQGFSFGNLANKLGQFATSDFAKQNIYAPAASVAGSALSKAISGSGMYDTMLAGQRGVGRKRHSKKKKSSRK